MTSSMLHFIESYPKSCPESYSRIIKRIFCSAMLEASGKSYFRNIPGIIPRIIPPMLHAFLTPVFYYLASVVTANVVRCEQCDDYDIWHCKIITNTYQWSRVSSSGENETNKGSWSWWWKVKEWFVACFHHAYEALYLWALIDYDQALQSW